MPASSTPAVPVSCCCSTRPSTWSAATRSPSRSRRLGDGPVGDRFDAVAHRSSADVDGELDVSEQRYEVMYFFDLADERIDEFKRGWGAIGDSIVVVGGDGLWNCHVHTNDIGAAIEVALDLDGRPKQIRVTDLFEEVDEEHAQRTAGMHSSDPGRRGAQPRRGRAPAGHHAQSWPCAAATGSSSCSRTSACRASSRVARR